MIFSKFKVVISVLVIVLISSSIFYSFSNRKLEQQRQLFLQEQLDKIDGELHDLGVRYCVIQPHRFSETTARGNMEVLLDFWEADWKKISDNMEKVDDAVGRYIFAQDDEYSNMPVNYLYSDGFSLRDTIRGYLDIEIDETDAEYYSVVKKYSDNLREELYKVFDVADIGRNDIEMKILADVTHDVTLNTIQVKKQYFYARFRNMNTEKIQAVRILYKKYAEFKPERGDRIFFYNLTEREFDLIRKLVRLGRDKSDVSSRITFMNQLEQQEK